MVDTSVNLLNGIRLLLGDFGNFINLDHNDTCLLHNIVQGLCGFLRNTHTVIDGLHRTLNQGCGIVGGLCTLSGQRTHLVSNDGESLTSGTSACGLNGSIQCENVGLECDIVDGLDNLVYFIGGFVNLVHCTHQLIHVLVALLHTSTSLGSHSATLDSIICILLHMVGQLYDGSRQLLNGTGLLGRTLCQSLRAVGNLVATHVDLVDSHLNTRQRTAQGTVHLADGH